MTLTEGFLSGNVFIDLAGDIMYGSSQVNLNYPLRFATVGFQLVSTELLAEIGCSEEFIHAVCSHGYGLVSDVEPVHEMEKVLFAADELTGLIGAAALMRPSKSCQDMEVSSLKKKFKDKKFAAGCSRDVIRQGAERLGWDLETLMERTILAMRACEADVASAMAAMAE